MERIIRHIHTLREQPHHIRRQAVYLIAGGITAVVALIWLSISLATNSFAIEGSDFADSMGVGTDVEQVYPDGSQVAGAAAAIDSQDQSPRIQIVNVAAPVAASSSEATTIPF